MQTALDEVHPPIQEALPDVTCPAPSAVLRLTGDQAGHIAGLAKALGHPVRVQIVELLSRHGGELCVCEIEQLFSLTQPTISHHLKVLRQAGIVDAEQRGLWAFYFLRPAGLGTLIALLEQTQQT